jgi:hypothetical protein
MGVCRACPCCADMSLQLHMPLQPCSSPVRPSTASFNTVFSTLATVADMVGETDKQVLTARCVSQDSAHFTIIRMILLLQCMWCCPLAAGPGLGRVNLALASLNTVWCCL